MGVTNFETGPVIDFQDIHVHLLSLFGKIIITFHSVMQGIALAHQHYLFEKC